MDREAWLAERRTGIGSSDAAAACGLKSFGRGPLDVYLDKLGILPPLEPSLAMEIGTALEPVIARAYERETGLLLGTPPPNIRSDVRPWMLANVDRLAADRIVELKWSGSAEGFGEPGTDQVPEGYLIQTAHQMAVFEIGLADVAVLIGRGPLRIYHLERNAALERRLVEIEGELWDRIQRRDPPEPDWQHEDTPKLLNMLWRPKPGVEVEMADQAFVEMLDSYVADGLLEKAVKKQRAEMQARLIAGMGEASLARLPDGRSIKRSIVAERLQKAHAVREHVRMDIIKAKGEQHGEDGDE